MCTIDWLDQEWEGENNMGGKRRVCVSALVWELNETRVSHRSPKAKYLAIGRLLAICISCIKV